MWCVALSFPMEDGRHTCMLYIHTHVSPCPQPLVAAKGKGTIVDDVRHYVLYITDIQIISDVAVYSSYSQYR